MMTSSSLHNGNSCFLAAEAIGARDEQQDANIVLSSVERGTALLVVSDGVGGESGGRIASQRVTKVALKMWEDHDGVLPDPAQDLNTLCQLAHEQINADGDRYKVSPRATIVALYLTPTQAYWVHSGDSRLYHFRDGKLIERTEDHSLLQLMLKQGLVKEEQMGSHPDQGLLVQALGGEQYRPPSKGSTQTTAGDAFLLCTDGFWERITLEEMAQLLFEDQPHVQSQLADAVKRAVQRNGPDGDNVTVAIALPAVDNADAVTRRVEPVHRAKRWPRLLVVCIALFIALTSLSFFYYSGRSPETEKSPSIQTQPTPTASTPGEPTTPIGANGKTSPTPTPTPDAPISVPEKPRPGDPIKIPQDPPGKEK